MAAKLLAMQKLKEKAVTRASADDKVPPVGSISSNGTPSSPLVSKLGGHLLPEGRRASMPGLSMLPGVPPAPPGPGAPTTGWGSPGSESPPTGLSPKPPGVPSRNASGPRSQSLLNPERSGGTASLRGTERLGSTGGASFDPLDPSLPPWVPQIMDRLVRLEGGSSKGGLSLPESVALGSRLQALEDAVRQTQMSYRTMQATVAEHTNMLYRQDRRGSHNGSRDREKDASASGGVSQDEFSALDKRLASMEVLLSSCSARLEDHDAQVMELGAKLQQYKEPAKAQGDMTQLQQQDAQLQEQLQVLKRKAEEAEQKLAALDAKVAKTAAAAAAAKAESAAATSAAAAATAAAASTAAATSAAAPAPLGVKLTSMGSPGAVAEGMAASGGAAASGDVAVLARKVAELEQQLMTTSSTAIDANSAVAMFNIRLDTYDQSISGSQSALQLLASKFSEFNSELFMLKERVNQIGMEASAAASAALSTTTTRTRRLSMVGLPNSAGAGGSGGLAAEAGALRDLEYRFNMRLNQVEAYVRKNGGTINNGTPPPERSLAATSGHGSSNALPSVMESDDSYLIPSGGPKQRFAVELEGGEKKLAERQELSKAVASAAKALSESTKASSEVASVSQELNMMKAALRMLHEQVVKVTAGGEGGDGGGSGGGASSEAVVAAAEAAAKAQKKADALEIIAKNFAMRLDTLADQCRSTAQVAEHAKEAATAAGLMGGAWGASSRPSYAADGGHGRGVRFADDGPGSPPPMPAEPGHAMQDIMRLASQQMEMLTRFQKVERDLMNSLMSYCKKTDLKDLETFVMDKHQQLQQEMEEVRASVNRAHVTAMTSNLAAAALANGGGQQGMGGNGGGGGTAASGQGNLMQRAQAVARNLAHSQSMAVARRASTGPVLVGAADAPATSPRKVRI